MADLTYAELFAGAGGMSMGLELAGWLPVAHAEIEPHARAVLRKHWPDCRLDGDVSQVDGADYRGITLLSGGSPCQDLSIAGKRGGMVEGSGTRSSLFFEQMRIWNESQAPYLLWENVLGALSSHTGRDFAAVLSALVGAPVPVPDDGWGSAGVASGPTGVAAWRVLDCVYFGPPQRRRRVFVLGARAGGVDPAQVLLECESLCGDSPAGEEAGEGAAPDAGSGIDSTLYAVAFKSGQSEAAGATFVTPYAPTLQGAANGSTMVPAVLTFDARGNGDGVDRNTITGDHQNRVTDYTALVVDKQDTPPRALAFKIRGGVEVDANGRSAGKGFLGSEELAFTLGTAQDQHIHQPAFRLVAFGEYAEDGTASNIQARDYKSATDLVLAQPGIPRRLMPVECERLMGWADGHTATGINEKGEAYALSDTARYKLVGNGVAAPVAGFIGWMLKSAIDSR